MGHAKSGQASDQANARRPGRCRRRERTSPIEGTSIWADQFSGHALATVTSLRSLRQEPVDATLTFSARGTSSHQLSKVDLTDRQAHDLGLRLKALRLHSADLPAARPQPVGSDPRGGGPPLATEPNPAAGLVRRRATCWPPSPSAWPAWRRRPRSVTLAGRPAARWPRQAFLLPASGWLAPGQATVPPGREPRLRPLAGVRRRPSRARRKRTASRISTVVPHRTPRRRTCEPPARGLGHSVEGVRECPRCRPTVVAGSGLKRRGPGPAGRVRGRPRVEAPPATPARAPAKVRGRRPVRRRDPTPGTPRAAPRCTSRRQLRRRCGTAPVRRAGMAALRNLGDPHNRPRPQPDGQPICF